MSDELTVFIRVAPDPALTRIADSLAEVVDALNRIAERLEPGAADPPTEPPPDWHAGLPSGWREDTYEWRGGDQRRAIRVLIAPDGRRYTQRP